MSELSKETDTASRRIKITDLARLSDVSKSTIHHYLNKGLLHPPKKLGLSLSVYDWTHLSKLKRIRELRENEKLPLERIKEVLSKESVQRASRENEAEIMISALESEKKLTVAKRSEAKKNEIMDAAIALFNRNGYEKTTLEAIADSLHMAKSTVYLYFGSKEDLFMECIERLTVVAVPEEAWDEIRREKNALGRLQKRGLAFHKAFPSYHGILTMTRAELGSDNKKLAERARNTLSHMTRPVAKDLRRGMADGIFREIDEELLAHFILAMGEGLGCRMMMDNRYTLEQGVKLMFDFVSHGILKKDPLESARLEAALRSGLVSDLKGVLTKVRDIRFGGRDFLLVRVGEAEVRIDPNKVEKIHFLQEAHALWAEVTGKDGQTQRAEVVGTLTLSGEVSLGAFAIELKNVASIVFSGKRS
jgi:AcrR family transcriptional regulator/predicted DNA-binding transcriptional regulator AlpA